MEGRAELAGCRLTLRPAREGALLPGSGRAVQAWWLQTVRAADPALAARLHHGSERRPFTCSPLYGLPAAAPGRMAPVSPERTYAIRLTGWDPEVVARLIALAGEPPEQALLGDTPFAVVQAALDPDTPPTTFAALAARHLLPPGDGGRQAADVTLQFDSATSFRQPATADGRPAPIPFPLPALVWAGLFDRWQAVSPVRLDPAARDALTARVAVSRFRGESQRVLLPGIGGAGGRWVVGFTGHCAYWWPRGDGYLGGILRLLAAFAGYAGVGQGTAYGLGQARWVRPGSTRHER